MMTGSSRNYITVDWDWHRICIDLDESFLEMNSIKNQEELTAWMLANFFPVPTHFEIEDRCGVFVDESADAMVAESDCSWEVSWKDRSLVISLGGKLTLGLKQSMTEALFEQWQQEGGEIRPHPRVYSVGEYAMCSGGGVYFGEISNGEENEQEQPPGYA
jgi:hypothetical protein